PTPAAGHRDAASIPVPHRADAQGGAGAPDCRARRHHRRLGLHLLRAAAVSNVLAGVEGAAPLCATRVAQTPAPLLLLPGPQARADSRQVADVVSLPQQI